MFELGAHGNSTIQFDPFMRTQKSTLQLIKKHSAEKPPRICIDMIRESKGGILLCESNGSLPRNTNQVYNKKR